MYLFHITLGLPIQYMTFPKVCVNNKILMKKCVNLLKSLLLIIIPVLIIDMSHG